MFTNCKNLEELRKTYKDMLRKVHPDNGGSTEECQAVNAAYQAAFEELKAGRRHFSDEKEEAREAKKWDAEEDEKIRRVLFNIVRLEGIQIELVGCWVWVDGNTYPYRDVLKENGFQWSKARKKWHFSQYEGKFYKNGKKYTFDDIRARYGSDTIEPEKTEKLGA